MLWAEDNPELLALMERGRMYVLRGGAPEEPVASSGYLAAFKDLEVGGAWPWGGEAAAFPRSTHGTSIPSPAPPDAHVAPPAPPATPPQPHTAPSLPRPAPPTLIPRCAPRSWTR
jgi:hypothetical protein